jgi:excisionase family DNA binding protein
MVVVRGGTRATVGLRVAVPCAGVGGSVNTGGFRQVPTKEQPAALLNVGDAAHYLAVSSEWLRTQEREGRFPSVRFNRTLRFRREDLDAWIDAHLVEAEN